MSEIGFEGSLEVGHNVKIGYFAQNQASLLDENLTVFETIDRIAEGDIRTKIQGYIGGFLCLVVIIYEKSESAFRR